MILMKISVMEQRSWSRAMYSRTAPSHLLRCTVIALGENPPPPKPHVPRLTFERYANAIDSTSESATSFMKIQEASFRTGDPPSNVLQALDIKNPPFKRPLRHPYKHILTYL